MNDAPRSEKPAKAKQKSGSRAVITLVKVILGLGAVILIVMWMSGEFREKVPPDAQVDAHLSAVWDGPAAEVESVTRTVTEQAAGTIEAARRTSVSAKILAQITEITVNAGDVVEAGDVLVRLDARDLKAQVDQAEQRVEAARAEFDKAQRDYERMQQLFKNRTVSESEVDAAEATLDVARAELARARNTREEAQVALSYAEIRAPVSGRVVDRLAEPGDTATPGQPILAIYDPQALRLEVPVRESLAVDLAPGDTIDVHIDATDETLTGHIDEIVPQAEAGARTFLVKVVLPGGEGLYTGMFGRLLLQTGEREHVVVPEGAIETIGQLTFVEVLDEENRLHRRMVTTGQPTEQGRVEVLSGLRPGERIALVAAD